MDILLKTLSHALPPSRGLSNNCHSEANAEESFFYLINRIRFFTLFRITFYSLNELEENLSRGRVPSVISSRQEGECKGEGKNLSLLNYESFNNMICSLSYST